MIGLQPSGGDDRAQILVALAAGPVYLAPGDWLISATIALGDNAYLECAPGATLKPTADSISVLSTSAGFRTGINLVNVNIDGTGRTGITGITLSNAQFNVSIVGANITTCTTGIQLDSVCIGVHVDRPTIYGTVNGIQILASNACVVTCPQIDHQTGNAPLTGTGIFITGGVNVVHGGFIQGFEFGVYDQGDYNKVDATYFELCTSCAIRWDGCKLPTAEDVFFFGYNAVAAACYLCVASGTAGGRVMRPRMVVDNSTGGLFFFSSGNSNCAADYTTDGGTTNSVAGTVTQISQIAVP